MEMIRLIAYLTSPLKDGRRKKVGGMERHVAIEAQELPHAISVTSEKFYWATGKKQGTVENCVRKLNAILQFLLLAFLTLLLTRS